MKTLACLIIDDVPLRPQYGKLNFEVLADQLRRHNAFAEIAFIPWYWRRINYKTANLFLRWPDRLALCVHGCNHVKNEFGGNDYEYLHKLASSAMWRMEQHQKKTGIPFDPVFVFPHESFSNAAMKALKETGFRAAISTEVSDKDLAASGKPYAEYDGLPMFRRRYRDNWDVFKKDMEAGRPVLITCQPEDFIWESEIFELVDWISGEAEEIGWCSLGKIAKHYLGKTAAPMPQHFPINYKRKDRYKIALRRRLCEFRDQHLRSRLGRLI